MLGALPTPNLDFARTLAYGDLGLHSPADMATCDGYIWVLFGDGVGLLAGQCANHGCWPRLGGRWDLSVLRSGSGAEARFYGCLRRPLDL